MKITDSKDAQKRLITGLKFPVDTSRCIISSPYYKMRTIDGETKRYWGIDFSPAPNDPGYHWQPIYAVADGYVFKNGWQDDKDHKKGFGLRLWQVIEIDGRKFDIFYGHMFYIIKSDKDIKKGETLGYMGSTGHSTGIHLHIEAREHLTRRRYGMEFYG